MNNFCYASFNAKQPGRYSMIRDLVHNFDERLTRYQVEYDDSNDDLLALFFEQIVASNLEIKSSLTAHHLAEIAKAAHTVKGMGGTVGAPEISLLGEEIESAAKANDLSRCKNLARLLEQWLALVQ